MIPQSVVFDKKRITLKPYTLFENNFVLDLTKINVQISELSTKLYLEKILSYLEEADYDNIIYLIEKIDTTKCDIIEIIFVCLYEMSFLERENNFDALKNLLIIQLDDAKLDGDMDDQYCNIASHKTKKDNISTYDLFERYAILFDKDICEYLLENGLFSKHDFDAEKFYALSEPKSYSESKFNEWIEKEYELNQIPTYKRGFYKVDN